MKKTLFVCMLIALALCLGGKSFAQAPRLKFQTEVHSFDTLAEGPQKSFGFAFTNTGSVPLIMETITTCGCTVADVPKEPVMPGKTGAVVVTYHTKGRPGPFNQTILLRAAAKEEPLRNQEEYMLKIRGIVMPAK